MKSRLGILLLHNHYKQLGGEDAVFAAEAALLEERGHRLVRCTTHNEAAGGINPLALAAGTVWNSSSYRTLREQIRRDRPHVLHVHNTLPLLSPSVYYAAKAEGVPVVQTLHNYRLLCPNALFFRDGRICEDCLGHLVPWPGVVHACYRGSRAATGVVATMLAAHRMLGTWTGMVDVYIALTDFARRKFTEGGLAAEKIVVKPNFVHPDPGVGEGTGGYALFVGRLSPEKGLETLLQAWTRLGTNVPLKIVGDGPLAPRVSEAAKKLSSVEWLGRKPLADVYALMGQAALLVFPSEWYETFGRVAIEAFAKGTPVLAADIGAISEIVADGRTGLHFRSSDPVDLAAKVDWLLTHPVELTRMRNEARAEYEAKYTAERNYQMLVEIYERAIQLVIMNEAGPVSQTVGYAGGACHQRRATYERGRYHEGYHKVRGVGRIQGDDRRGGCGSGRGRGAVLGKHEQPV